MITQIGSALYIYPVNLILSMKTIITGVLALFLFSNAFGQQTSSRILSQKAAEAILTASVKSQFNISYPVRRVYECTDQSGKFLVIVTETIDSITAKKDTLHYKIKTLNLGYAPTGLVKNWEISDFRIVNTEVSESSVWFWTKFFKLEDLDHDGLIDPVVVYGSAEDNDAERTKYIVVYKGKKIAVRHQNSSMDEGRNIQVDKAFYGLPVQVQQSVKTIMKQIEDKDFTIFPTDWRAKMDRKVL